MRTRRWRYVIRNVFGTSEATDALSAEPVDQVKLAKKKAADL